MLDGNRYYAEFPDEGRAQRTPNLQSPTLIATLHALEKELRPFVRSLLLSEGER
jgi:hypothetical protein